MSESIDRGIPGAPRFDLAGRTALVTGAARGIGRGCAIGLAQAGADLALGFLDAASADARSLVEIIESLGRRAVPLQMDVTRREQIVSATAAALAALGRIDVLVNNAGIGPPNPAESVTEADFDRTVGVNLKGTFFVSQEVGAAMIRGGPRRADRQPQLAGRVRGAADGVGLLHDQGGDRAPDQVPRGRVGAPRHQRQRGSRRRSYARPAR